MRWIVAATMIVVGSAVTARAMGAEPAPRAIVTVGRHGISVEAHAVPLRNVLLEIAQRAGFALRFDDDVDVSATMTPTTVTFDRVAVEEAIARVLRGVNFVLAYRGTRIEMVSVYGDAHGRPRVSDAATPARARADRFTVPRRLGDTGRRDGAGPTDPVALEQAALFAADPEERAAALRELEAAGEARYTRDVAVAVLEREANETVLDVALGLLNAQDSVPVEPLLRFVEHDRPIVLRLRALELATEHGGNDPRVRALLAKLTANRDDGMREAAQSMLDDLSQ